ncbi:phosphatase PAP2 family protein [Leifsonia sp. fls2-241-R2A-40a]|uniref:phosphatase PAP2 family protein n=1 Tax=Leifsonia sp. fls2-241-R2A-40a TaxID=3040290 RepID=UPI00254DC623|nr:phosphatase PAP2 family protein [Leifsonia sp. fls2-241-R2A-40a]
MSDPTPRRSGRWSEWHEKFVVEERSLPASARRRLYITAAVLAVVGLTVFLILLVAVATHTGAQRWDQPVEDWFDAQRSKEATGFMIVLAIIFGPIAMPVIVLVVVVVWTVMARHIWRPFLLAVGMLTGVLLAGALAPLVRHPRPPVAEMLFGPDHSFSFPSGHVLGTSDFLLILAFLLASRRQRPWFTVTVFALAIAGIVLQVYSRLYLGYHWITDTSASVALSLVVLGGIIALDTVRTVRVDGEKVDGDLSQKQVHGT